MREHSKGARPDFILLIATLILITFGTAMIYSSSSIIATGKYGDGYYFLKKQLFFVLIGLVLMLVLSKVPYEHMKKIAYPGILVSIVLLCLIFIPYLGVKVGGARRWLRTGLFTFQVSEMVKVAFIIFLAFYLSKRNQYIREFKRGLLVPLAMAAGLIGLIMLQPDFGTAAIIAAALMSMLYLAGSRGLHLAGLVSLLLPAAAVLILMKGYRLKRVLSFLDPWKDPQNTGFQIIQSFLSFGSGGTFGVGLGDGMQKLFYLPEPHTDFILSVIAEESGFIGVLVVIALFLVLVMRGFMICFKAPDLFGSLLAGGLTSLIALEAFINIAAVTALVPTKGLALPFMSYGGSSLIMSMASVGILLSVSSAR
jgi:cell division protein FtsW